MKRKIEKKEDREKPGRRNGQGGEDNKENQEMKSKKRLRTQGEKLVLLQVCSLRKVIMKIRHRGKKHQKKEENIQTEADEKMKK